MSVVKNIHTDIDLHGNELRRFRVESLASDPSAVDGGFYYNTTDRTFRGCADGIWRSIVDQRQWTEKNGVLCTDKDVTISGIATAARFVIPKPAGGSYDRFRLRDDGSSSIVFQAATYDGKSTGGSMIFSGLYGDPLAALTIISNNTLFRGPISVEGGLDVSGSVKLSSYLYLNSFLEGIYLDGTGIYWHDAGNTYTNNLLFFKQSTVRVTVPMVVDQTLWTTGSSVFASTVLVNKLLTASSGIKIGSILLTDENGFLKIEGNAYVTGSSVFSSTVAVNKLLTASSGIKIGSILLTDDNGFLKIEGNAYATGSLAAGGIGEDGGAAGGGVLLLTSLQDVPSDLEGYALGASIGVALNARVTTLESKATAVSFTQTLTSGKAIGTLTIDGTSKVLYAPSVTKSDVGLGSVENTALSSWAGTSKITTLGTITTGTWNGTKIANAYLANSAITINGTSTSLGGSFSTASITAGTAGTSSATSGYTLSVPYVTMNKYGIVTGYGTHTHTVKNIPNSSLVNSAMTIAGTSVSLGGSISATTIGAALTSSAPAAYATNAGNSASLGGVSSARFLRTYIMNNTSAFNADSMADDVNIFVPNGDVGSYAASWQNFPISVPAGGFSLFSMYEGNYKRQLFGAYNDRHLWTRSQHYINGSRVWSEWSKFALTTDNVASATKLETARTIWGQSFNGTANVSGSMTGVTTITASGAVSFGSTLSVSGLLTASSGIKVAAGKSITFLDSGGGSHTLSYDSTNKAFKIDGNLYTTGELAAGAVGAAA